MKNKKELAIWFESIYDQISDTDIVVDLGACVGDITKIFSEKAKNGWVIAVEPIYENYKFLVNKIVINNQKNVIPILAGISNKTGLRNIFIDKYPVGHSCFKKGRMSENTPIRLMLVISWDDLVEMLNINQVDFVKVDIEGSELELLEGMSKVLPEKMIIEDHSKIKGKGAFSPLIPKFEDRLYELLEARGYKILQEFKYYIYVSK